MASLPTLSLVEQPFEGPHDAYVSAQGEATCPCVDCPEEEQDVPTIVRSAIEDLHLPNDWDTTSVGEIVNSDAMPEPYREIDLEDDWTTTGQGELSVR